ncbi:HNH endonuclease [Pantoea osteomyelitidis]|uniref:HNH endonuclease n=1 Tax=Pantoea osteomyelitidis TaxID=3230026 RepID=A0ABW7Q1U2_9GAMM
MSLPALQSGTRIYDLLKQAGMKLENWSGPASPLSMQWAWLENDVAVVNIWLDNVHQSESAPGGYVTRYIALGKKHKGRAMDKVYRAIAERQIPVQVILHTEKGNSLRVLDDAFWSADYNPSNNELTLIREKRVVYVDQKSGAAGSTEEDTSQAVIRSKKLRTLAMQRSKGICEHCGSTGFRTAKGEIFAEVHHIEPVSSGGADELINLIVLCPNDHRQAHFGEDAEALKARFLQIRSV